MSGLTTRQQWAHDHIARCPCCGSWELITETERAMRELNLNPRTCHHIETALTSQENAA